MIKRKQSFIKTFLPWLYPLAWLAAGVIVISGTGLWAGPALPDDGERVKIKNQSEKNEEDDIPIVVTATRPGQDPEGHKNRNKFRQDLAEKKALLDRMQWRLSFFTDGAGFNNADLRELDESNDAAIDFTDDRRSFAVSGFDMGFYFPLTDDLAFNLSFFKIGFWGHDQLAGRDVNNNNSKNPFGANPINIGNEFNIDLFLYHSRHQNVNLIVGRQYFGIGGIPSTSDYIQDDVLDAVVLKYSHWLAGQFDFLLFDYFWQGSDALEVNYVTYVSGDNEKVDNFDGDVNTVRYGLVYGTPNLLDWGGKPVDYEKNRLDMWLQTKLYTYLADYGAGNEGGSDRTNLGATDNFADNDYVQMFGGRLLYNMDLMLFYADYAISKGRDRKAHTLGEGLKKKNVDVDTDGKAITVGTLLRPLEFKPARLALKTIPVVKDISLDIHTDFFLSDGATFDKDGNQTSHGFVGFKGAQAGGILLDKYYGLHPSAYTDDDGIDDWPHDRDRKAGTQMIHFGYEIGYLGKFFFNNHFWMLKDTGSSDITNPQNRSDFAQANRLGKDMGMEMDFGLRYTHNKYLQFYAIYGVFKPGPFYESSAIVESAPAGNTTMSGGIIGARLVF